MFVNYNFKELLAKEFSLTQQNRSFMYGDSVFETIMMVDQQIYYLNDHTERLFKGLKALSMVIPAKLTQKYIEGSITSLVNQSALTGVIRIKIHVWRNEGGLLIPTHDQASFLIVVSRHARKPVKIKSLVSFFDEVKLHYSPFSGFKSGNMLPYILAGIFTRNQNLDDVILSSTDGYITECVSANIFWIKHHTFFTPSLDCGCIAGVMRKQVISFLRDRNIDIKEGQFTRKELLDAEAIFTCNVGGIQYIKQIDNTNFEVSNLAVETLNKELIPYAHPAY